MPIEGIEWAIVFVIFLLMIFWKPESVGELLKAIARARVEFAKAQTEFSRMISFNLQNYGSEPPSGPSALVTSAERADQQTSEDWKLIKIAKDLNIRTEGLTRDQIKEVIDAKLKEITNSYRSLQSEQQSSQ